MLAIGAVLPPDARNGMCHALSPMRRRLGTAVARPSPPVSIGVVGTTPASTGFPGAGRPDQGVETMVTLEKAHRVIAAGEAKAREIGQPMNIAVVDAGTNLKAFIRMDNAWLGSIDIAINKAFTAKAFDISTLELGQNSQPGDQFFGIHVSNHDRVMIFAGGVPLKVDGKIVGAVGVSGGSGEQDQAVAEAAAAVCS
jgi:uncharacterized protein GlcG (DUF336 family)